MHTFTPSLCCSHPGESKAGRLFRGPVRLTLIHSPSPPRPPPLSLSSSVSISGWPKIEKAAIAGTGLPLTGRIQGWGGRGGGFQPGCGCRASLEAPLRGCRGGARFLLPSPPVSTAATPSSSPLSSCMLGVARVLGRGIVRSRGHSPRWPSGGQLQETERRRHLGHCGDFKNKCGLRGPAAVPRCYCSR